MFRAKITQTDVNQQTNSRNQSFGILDSVKSNPQANQRKQAEVHNPKKLKISLIIFSFKDFSKSRSKTLNKRERFVN